MKKNLFILLASMLLLFKLSIAQLAISPYLMGQNGWRPFQVGGGSNPHDTVQCPGLSDWFGNDTIPCKVHGNIDALWQEVKQSGVHFARYGGTAADQNIPNPEHYLAFVDSVRTLGMEPILQIPINFEDQTDDYDTTNAIQIIQFINDFPNYRNVTYWSIGNEPDLKTPRGYGYNTNTEAILIANYTKDFSKAMRRAVSSVPIKILGPELAEWNSDPGYPKKQMVDSLLSPGRCDITGFDTVTGAPWIDIFSYHYYGGLNGDTIPVSHDSIVRKLRSDNSFAETAAYLKQKLPSADSTHGRLANPILAAVTEANIAYQHVVSNDTITGTRCNSFIAGQYWLEMAGICAETGTSFLNYWASADSKMGYMRTNGTKKSTYHHFKLFAENIRGSLLGTSDFNSHVKVIASRSTETGISVIIMNQKVGVNYSCTIYFDSTGASGNYINIGAGLSGISYATGSIEGESTWLLNFDLGGNLKKICKYELYGHADAGLPPTCTDYCIGTSDAYIKGHWADDGYEPSALNPWDLYAGNDIWIRNSAASQTSFNPPAYANEHQHENPEWTSDTALVPRVYVKVRNRGCDSVTGTLRLYYTRGNLGDKWDTLNSIVPGKYGHWTEIGNGKPVTLAITQSGTYAFKWDSIAVQPDPNLDTLSNFNFCLLARFISPNDPMLSEANDTSAGWNAWENNNIAQKNVILVDDTTRHCIIVRNIHASAADARIEFEAKDQNTRDLLDNGGHVYVDLSDSLYTLWAAGGKIGSGVKDISADRKIEITDRNAYIGNISLAGSIELFLCFEFEYEPGTAGIVYDFDSRLFLDSSFTGAERFIVPYPDCPQVDAGEDQTIGTGCELTLTGEPEHQFEHYAWIIYDCPSNPSTEGDTVGLDRRTVLTAGVTTTYQAYLRLDNGCYSSDLVTVTVDTSRCRQMQEMQPPVLSVRSELLDCAPNPASESARFNYTLERDAIGEIRLSSAMGRVLKVHSLQPNSTSTEVSCSELSSGIYFYSMYVNGKFIRTKKLVIAK